MINLILRTRKTSLYSCLIKRTSIETLFVLKPLVYSKLCIQFSFRNETSNLHTSYLPSLCSFPVIGQLLRASV